VVRALTAGTLERRYADGKKENRELWKPGMVQCCRLRRLHDQERWGKTKLSSMSWR